MCIIGKRILVVEDTPSISLFLQANLRNEGANVTVVDTYAQAKRAFEKAYHTDHPYELLLVDLNLPDCSGVSLLTDLDGLDHQPTCIAMSADGTEETETKALSAGADMFIEKPFDISNVIKIIKDRLHERDVVTKHSTVQNTSTQAEGLRQTYVAHLNELKEKLNKTVPYRQLRSLIHQLKGSAALYGYAELSRCAQKCSEELHNSGPYKAQKIRDFMRQEIENTLTSDPT